ncbi:MAG: hypothetical protein QG650_364 [Patescibacteria group bacterium]|nr:hypothetical protein [Patescibacteria group bacterium]
MRSPQSSETLQKKSAFVEFLPAILLAASILLAVFSAYPDYYSLTAKQDEYAQAAKEKTDKQAELAMLGDFKTQSSVPAFAIEIFRYASPFREDHILESLFSAGNSSSVLPLSIGIDRGTKMPNGLSQGNVELALRVTSQTALMKYFEYLTGTSGKKRYVIKAVNFPYDSTMSKSDAFQVTVSLGFSHYSPR